MMDACIPKTGQFVPERVCDYAPNAPETKALKKTLSTLKGEVQVIPMHIGGEEVRSGQRKMAICPPHEHAHVLGHFYEGDAQHVKTAIEAAQRAKGAWMNMPWRDRAAIFLRAAELLAGPYRDKINATTMLGQSKNVIQAEVDAACELIDFLRFNVSFLEMLYRMQPVSSTTDVWNQLEYRPLEGFVFAITPFNFTSIAANLALLPALMGNTVVWKPAYPQIYSAQVVMEVFKRAGIPPGVVNLIYVDGPVAGEVIFKHPDFAGLHFTGSTSVFQDLWGIIGSNIRRYRSYPRVVGETGGKNFIVAHPSADVDALHTAMIRGAFEYQGQKCSAASRAYIPDSLWPVLRKKMADSLSRITVGNVEDFSHFMGAVISRVAFDRITKVIEQAKKDRDATLLFGGTYEDKTGYFIAPTVFQCSVPDHFTMREEIFGPVLSVYVYPEKQYAQTLATIDKTSIYGLTGAVFATERAAILQARERLCYAAGNFYINDKPTGAVVSQQPFGGSRASGTNDKAGSLFNLLRWVSPRTIKENFTPPNDFFYPHMG